MRRSRKRSQRRPRPELTDASPRILLWNSTDGDDLREMACGRMPAAVIDPGRPFGDAASAFGFAELPLKLRAARAETAALHGGERRRHLARKDDSLAGAFRPRI